MSKHEHEKPKDVFSLLGGFYQGLQAAVSGKHGDPGRTALARVAVLVLGFGCAAPILWAALRTMPAPLGVLIILFVAFRVVRWYWRRGR